MVRQVEVEQLARGCDPLGERGGDRDVGRGPFSLRIRERHTSLLASTLPGVDEVALAKMACVGGYAVADAEALDLHRRGSMELETEDLERKIAVQDEGI
jgi:hypothetical protein